MSKFRAVFGRGLNGYTVALFFCKPTEISQMTRVQRFDSKVGISTKQLGHQRVLDIKRIRKMAKILETIAQTEHMFDFGGFRLFAEKDVVTFHRDSNNVGEITINGLLDLIDGQHRDGVIGAVSDGDGFEFAKQRLHDLDVACILLIPPTDRDERFMSRDKRQMFDFANTTQHLSQSQLQANHAVETILDIEDGLIVKKTEFFEAVIAKAWDRMSHRVGWVWSNRVDFGTVKAESRSNQQSATIAFSEMRRTTKEILSVIKTSVNADGIPEMQEEGPQLHVFEQNVQVLSTVLSKWWQAINKRLPDVCSTANFRRYKLMSSTGTKALNYVLAAYLRYAVIRPHPKFLKKYGVYSCVRAVEDGDGTPLADVLDHVGSYLRDHEDSRSFWKVNGAWNDFGSSFNGLRQLAERLWMCMRQDRYGESWGEFCFPKSPRQRARRAIPGFEDEDNEDNG